MLRSAEALEVPGLRSQDLVNGEKTPAGAPVVVQPVEVQVALGTIPFQNDTAVISNESGETDVRDWEFALLSSMSIPTHFKQDPTYLSQERFPEVAILG